ncbi:MAG: SPOR domain-containing protein [Noviherbaspirillum sp.]
MMLKFFFWILLLANAGLIAYQQGYFDTFLSSGHEPARMANQLNADKVKVIPEPKRAPAPAAPPAAEPAPLAAPAPKPVVIACTEIGNFNPDEARRFKAELSASSFGERVSQRPIQEVASHMVYIPPQADKDAADKKAGELQRLGINDFFVIQDNSPMRWAISLGVFKQEEAARAHLANLNQKGVRSARIAPRTVNTNMIAFQARNLDADAKGSLQRIKAGFPKQEIRGCEVS